MPDIPPPVPEDETLLAHLDASAALLGIPVAPEWRAEVLANMRALNAAARLVLLFPLEDEAEPAPVFRA